MNNQGESLRQAIPDLRNRLRRIEGQARGIQRMLDEGRSCQEIITQVAALRAAVAQVGVTSVSCVLEESIRRAVEHDSDTSAAVEQARKLLSKI